MMIDKLLFPILNHVPLPGSNVTGNITGIHGMALYVNSATMGWFWPIILLVFYTIMFISMKVWQTKHAFAAVSLIGGLVSIFFVVLNLITFDIFLIAAIASGIAMMLSWWED